MCSLQSERKKARFVHAPQVRQFILTVSNKTANITAIFNLKQIVEVHTLGYAASIAEGQSRKSDESSDPSVSDPPVSSSSSSVGFCDRRGEILIQWRVRGRLSVSTSEGAGSLTSMSILSVDSVPMIKMPAGY